jgi:predicted outer membrane repeat protein
VSERQFRRAGERRAEAEAKRRRRLTGKVGIGAGAALGATVLFAPSANAATFTVTNLDNAGPGSLRQAVVDANQLDGNDTVVFQSGLSGTINLTGVDSDIEIYYDGLTIQGPGPDVIAVDGNNNDRIFYAFNFDQPNSPLDISGLTLRHGNGGSGNLGGALYSDGGGVGVAPDLTLTNMMFRQNSASGRGGAVWQDEGSLTIRNSVFANNEAGGGGGAVYSDDTAGTQPVEVTISGSTFRNNTAGGEGGALNLASDAGLAISDSVITGNSAGGNSSGGGIYIDDVIGPTTIQGINASANTSEDYGGGLEFNGDGNAHALNITNSTFANNRAPDHYGGGIHTQDTDGPITIANTTLSGNKATWGGGAYLYDMNGPTTIDDTTISGNSAFYGAGGIWLEPTDGAVSVRNTTIADNSSYYTGGLFLDDDNGGTSPATTISSSIIADNTTSGTGFNPAVYGTDIGADGSSAGFATGFSLIGTPDAVPLGESPAGSNITGQNPQLGALADNGGPTQTMLPALTSPAIDAGVANGLASDQRGLSRTDELSSVPNRAGSDGTDMGAVEIQTAQCGGVFIPSKVGTENGETINGTDGPDAILALGGDDTASGLGAEDCVDGGNGGDTLFGNTAGDSVTGGGGDDTASGDEGNDNVKGDDGNDSVSGGTGKDNAFGGAGNDRVKGDKGKDKVKGNAGKDIVIGGPGKDKLKGNAGKDKLRAIDQTKDKVNCGGGKDKARVDAIDKVGKNCEVVKVAKK